MRFVNLVNLIHLLVIVYSFDVAFFLLLFKEHFLLLLVKSIHVFWSVEICRLNELLHVIHLLLVALKLRK